MTAPAADAQPPKRHRLVYVDVFRGLAALTVLCHHTTTLFPNVFVGLEAVNPIAHRAVMFISDRNYDAVLLFFVLSGFSIRLSAGRAGLITTGDVNLYLYRRFKRILPLYFGAIVLTGLLGALGGHINEPEFSLRTLAGNLVFLQTPGTVRGAWFFPYGNNGPLWSLSYEMFYYLLFPVLVIGLAGFRTAKRTISFACAAALSVLALALFQVAPCPPLSFLSLFLVWFYGADLAEHYLSGAQDGRATVVLLIAGSVALIVGIQWLPSVTMQSWAVGCSIYCGWRASFSLLKNRTTNVSKLANILRALCRPLAHLGYISYALYLFHFPLLISAAATFGQTLPVLTCSVALALGLAWIGEWIAALPRYAFMKLNYVGRAVDRSFARSGHSR